MLRLMLILLIALAAPAMPASACDMPQPATHHVMPGMMHHQRSPDHRVPATQHLCIGCVPVADLYAAPIAPPLLLPAPAPFARIAALAPRPGDAPVPPPPRI